MASVVHGVLPIYSNPKHTSLFNPSLGRGRFIISLFTFATIGTLLFWGYRLLIQPHISLQPLLFDDHSPPTVALTPLGLEAEEVYNLGSLSRPVYRNSLDSFINSAFPPHLRSQLTKSLHQFLDFESMDALRERPKIVWQTHNMRPQNKQTQSWQNMNKDHEYHFLNDEDAQEWVRRTFNGSAIEWTWNCLPQPVMKADLLRYLLLLVTGGIYSDVDTTCLKPAHVWGSDPDIRRQGGKGSSSTIVGVEADVGDRADWHQWWSRPIQIAQWTIASRPGHPVLLDTVRRIYENSVEVQRRLHLDPSLTKESILARNMTVMEWTGPAVFTDATLRFIRIDSGLKWSDLRGLTNPLRAGSITILPVTGFSPGVQNFRAKSTTDKQAMVHHDFDGSWKEKTSGQKHQAH